MTQAQEDILQIAEYMGGREYVHKTHYPHYMSVEAELLDGNDLRFDTDWNWLVPVVKKVLQQLKERKEVINVHKVFMAIEDIQNKLLALEIEPLYTAVVQAIKLLTDKQTN